MNCAELCLQLPHCNSHCNGFLVSFLRKEIYGRCQILEDSADENNTNLQILNITRIHSSRMRTTRLLPVSPSMHCSGGTWSWGVHGPGGCTWSGGGVPGLGGVPGPRGWGMYLVLGGVPGPRGVPAQVPPVNRMTDRCKNITLPQTSFAGGNN